jgi:hypothetical protein
LFPTTARNFPGSRVHIEEPDVSVFLLFHMFPINLPESRVHIEEPDVSVFLLFHMFPTLISYPNSHSFPDCQAVQILAAIRLSNPAKIDRMVVTELRTDVRDEYGTDENHVPLSSQGVPTMYDLMV